MNEPTFVDVDSLRGLLAGEAVVPAAGPDSQAGQLSGRTASWGRVVSRAGGQGLAGVTVVLEGATVTTAVTDSQGQYYIEDLRSGFYTVTATKGDLHDYQFPTLQVEISPTAPGLPTLVPPTSGCPASSSSPPPPTTQSARWWSRNLATQKQARSLCTLGAMASSRPCCGLVSTL